VFSDPIQRGEIIESVYGIGTVTANRIYRIMPGVVNTIREVFVKEGDSVKKGQKLIGNDAYDYHAPFDGTVTSLPYKIGENVFPQIPILTLVDMQDRYLVVSMEQQGALRVQRGQRVKMSFDSVREQNYDGVVSAVYSNDNNFLARIDIGTLPVRILPGMTADVAIAITQHDNVVLVPVAALEHGKYVWVKQNHRIPRRIEVKTGIIDKAMAEIISGDVEIGDRLLIRKDLNR
jgi:membrane fusion protein, macrolide-specific efflux system